ncbi:glycosyltransferase [Marinobacter orientalis]|uniref:Glycosyltransferase n=1 Tax=Marinobacter orientalis TaxID=1928859 RepID=A0A7Y0WTV0_9GAMM|nr:glycosyltransferase [Marinobacter orientalis]NMT65289.1 glycosyltransferase [Marinobacter orientalis]TGX47939.1 glycosyltransferase [Marinobacter orientalis]
MDARDRLTIALVMATPGTGWGGMEKHTADLAEALSARGHKVHMLAHSVYSERFITPVRFHALPFQMGRRNPWLRFRLRQTLHAIQADILHAQGNKAASLIGAVRHCARVTVGTLHGSKSSHHAFDRLDGVIGVSREITNSIEHPNTRLIFNGLQPLEKTSHSDHQVPRIPVPAERPLLLAAGRLEPVKQFDRLVRAWAQADCDGKLVILGDGSQRSRLNALIRELGAEDSILLPGHEPRIFPWLQAATACIISSSREGFPYIMVEALIAGCPVLSTPVSGVRDFLPQSCIAASDSPEDIATLISTNLAEPGLLTEIQSKSFEQAREQLNLETMVSKTETFYRDLLASLPARR